MTDDMNPTTPVEPTETPAPEVPVETPAEPMATPEAPAEEAPKADM